MATVDKNRQPGEHPFGDAEAVYNGVQLTDSAQASVKDVENIRRLSGQAKEAATAIARRKRQLAAAVAASKK